MVPLTLNSVLLEHLINETKAGKMEWKFIQVSYIYKSDKFSFSFNIKENGLIRVMLHVIGEGTDIELYTPYDNDWVIVNNLKDAIIASCSKSAA